MARLTGWRRIAGAIWGDPRDPQIYGALDIDASALLGAMEKLRAAGHHVTPTHFVGRALAQALVEVPDLNAQIRGGRILPRKSVDIFFITSVKGGNDLSGVKCVDVPSKSVVAIAAELAARSGALRRGEDKEFSLTKRTMDALPHPILKLMLRAAAMLSHRGVNLKAMALKAYPFGSGMVTSVGMFGLPQGFAPLAWMYGVPILVLVGELGERAVVVDHEIVVRPILPITATLDHRYVDGWHISRAMKAFRGYLQNPAEFEPELRAAP
jgi:pyruvate dehydrogenase E2 component (dihydrolipoamide acetyltransferase)